MINLTYVQSIRFICNYNTFQYFGRFDASINFKVTYMDTGQTNDFQD